MATYTKNQEKQLNWADKMELREIAGQFGLANLPNYDMVCRTCNVTEVHHCANFVSRFIDKHIGHDTWITFYR